MKLHLIAAGLIAIVATVSWVQEESTEKKPDELTKATFLIKGLH